MDRNLDFRAAVIASGVASREGGVDRNARGRVQTASRGGRLPRGGRGSQQIREIVRPYGIVASREGGVDRNPRSSSSATSPKVASREGGVDRNRQEDVIAVLAD